MFYTQSTITVILRREEEEEEWRGKEKKKPYRHPARSTVVNEAVHDELGGSAGLESRGPETGRIPRVEEMPG